MVSWRVKKRVISKMLSALGELNAEILSAHYGGTAPHPAATSNMVRRANALNRRAHGELRVAQDQLRAIDEDVGLARRAAITRHVARRTAHKNTMCVGPCAHVPRATVKQIRAVVPDLHGPGRVDAVARLADTLTDMPDTASTLTHDNPRLCVATGVPCAAAQFDSSSDYKYAEGSKKVVDDAKRRVHMMDEMCREARHSLDLARSVGQSQVREMEVGHISLNGGGTAPAETPANIARFFHAFSLGDVPRTWDIRVALNSVSSRFAPRARDAVLADLQTRWAQFDE